MSAPDLSSSSSHSRQRLLPMWMTLIALFGAPGAWLLQMWFSEPLAAHACYPHAQTLDHPLLDHLSLDLAGIGVLALLAGIGALAVAWRGRHTIRSASAGRTPSAFLCDIGLLSSSACVIAIVFTLAAALLVAPCQPWS